MILLYYDAHIHSPLLIYCSLRAFFLKVVWGLGFNSVRLCRETSLHLKSLPESFIFTDTRDSSRPLPITSASSHSLDCDRRIAPLSLSVLEPVTVKTKRLGYSSLHPLCLYLNFLLPSKIECSRPFTPLVSTAVTVPILLEWPLALSIRQRYKRLTLAMDSRQCTHTVVIISLSKTFFKTF